MMRALVQRLTLSVVGAALAATLVAVGGVVAVTNALATTTLTATANVNVRSGPGNTFSIVGMVAVGDSVIATGPAVTGPGSGTTWTPITYAGKKAYVGTNYFKISTTDPAPTTPPVVSGTAGTGTTTADVNVRSGPDTSYDAVGLLAKGTSVSLTGGSSGRWLEFLYKGEKRWVSGTFINTGGGTGGGTTQGQVRTTATVYLRAEGTNTAAKLGTVPADSVVDVTGETTATYTQIVYKGVTGWIASSYTAPVKSSPSGGGDLTDTQKKIVAYALAQVGDAYVWGAAGPNSFDCSGLTLAAYRAAGLSLPHYSRSQAALGRSVAKADLQPGDLIFWYSPISHVSLYIGDGMMVHARNTRVGVVKQSVDGYINMGARYTTARRILSDL